MEFNFQLHVKFNFQKRNRVAKIAYIDWKIQIKSLAVFAPPET